MTTVIPKPDPLPQAVEELQAFPDPGWIPGGATADILLKWEVDVARGDGRAGPALDAIVAKAETASASEMIRLYRQTLDLPVDPEFPYDEPYELEAIRALRPPAKARQYDVPHDDSFLYDRLYGAWLGRCAGCTLGAPAETFRPHTRMKLRDYMTSISPDEWPVKDYLPPESPSEYSFKKWRPDARRGNINYAPQDDDLTHTVVSQLVLSELNHPGDFETQDLARGWYQYLPYRWTEGGTCMMAFRNLTIRYPMRRVGRCAPGADPIDWQWVATHSNPYRENIDASLRADHYGYAAPGMPEFAADLAWRDGRSSNVKSGLYCAMFYAAMIAAAFAKDDVEEVVKIGLAEIPTTSRMYEAALKAIEISRKHLNSYVDELHGEIYDTFGDNDNSIICNMAAVVSALIVGQGDFEKSITFAVMCGWDCDCTGASTGSIVGAMLGAKKLPDKWISPMNDTLQALIVGYDPIPISECASRSVAIAKKSLGV